MEQIETSEISYEEITEMNPIDTRLYEGLDHLRLRHKLPSEGEQIVELSPRRVESIYLEDWVMVPMDENITSPTHKQKSNCSSLDRTLSYEFAQEIRNYEHRKLMNSFFPVGKGRNELSNPHGLAVDRNSDRLYIADTNNNRIQIHPEENISLLKERTRSLSQMFLPDPNMDMPWGICVSQGHMFVTQYNAHCVDVYTCERSFVTRFGSNGFGIGQFSSPTGICVDETDVYVCDSNNNRIQIFTKENKEYKFRKSFGICNLTIPLDIKISNKQIFVLDSSKKCLHKYDSKYKHLKSFITNGPKHEVDNPKFFDIDQEGNFLISDWLNHSVKVFNNEGVKVSVIGTSIVWIPKGIAVGKHGDVFVVDDRGEGLLKHF